MQLCKRNKTLLYMLLLENNLPCVNIDYIRNRSRIHSVLFLTKLLTVSSMRALIVETLFITRFCLQIVYIYTVTMCSVLLASYKFHTFKSDFISQYGTCYTSDSTGE